MLRDENNPTLQAGFIGGFGLMGFLVGSFSKRFRFLKRVLYTTVGSGGAAAFVYPIEAKHVSLSAADEAKRLGLIAYNFVQGVQPSAQPPKVENEVAVLSEDDKKFLSDGGKTVDLKTGDQSHPDDKDMYTTRDSK